ncbi:unnamed protein product [Adineta ricciae]|uniref:Uncharacterized protein n=1 Tax=Adineta ricciae TaxID=249248 RepID=A0A815WAX3_ADIRI|nr:unnamed protein product [Adineta ricciae]
MPPKRSRVKNFSDEASRTLKTASNKADYVGQTGDKIEYKAKQAKNAVADATSTTKKKVNRGAESIRADIGRKTGTTKAAAQDAIKKAKNATDRAKSAARSTRKATDNAYKGTKRAARKAADSMKNTANSLTSKTNEFAQKAAKPAGQAAENASHGLSDIKKSIEGLFK